MSVEWQPNTRGRCGECGAMGEFNGSSNTWTDADPGAASGSEHRSPSVTHYYEERWACECGCTWWEQYRWRGQTKERRS